ncbi:MAG TPA: ATP-binding protein [Bordetella sp.]|nr:ATP-binding protein [Bordetella sp.]
MKRWLAVLLLLWVASLAGASVAEPAAEPVFHLDSAEFFPGPLPSRGDVATLPTTGGSRVTLPDNWRLMHPDLSGFAWYVIRFPLAAPPSGPLVLYVPRVSLAAEFWLNGSLLNPGVRYDTAHEVGSTMSDRPVHLILPSGLFRQGENILAVRLQGSTQIRSGISAVTIAPPGAVDDAWRLRYLCQVVVPYGILVLVMGATCFLAAHIRRQRRPHIIQLGLLVGVVAVVLYTVADIPMDRGAQEVARICISCSMYWALCTVGYRISGYTWRGVLPAWHVLNVLTLVAVLGAALLYATSDRLWLLTWPHQIARVLFVIPLACRAWQDRSIKFAALAASALLWGVTQVQSGLILMEWTTWDTFRWSVAGGLPFCIVLLFVFAERFILDVEEAAVAQRQAIVTERGRILQDMHDGMGAHLVTALHMARRPEADREELVRSLEESLQDLRLIIDSLDVPAHDLLPLLANLRFRLEPRLNALGIRLEWDVQPLPALPSLGPDGTLSVLRIVQEAINNAIRHGEPRTLRIGAHPDGTAVRLTIVDDGRGFTESAARAGAYGLSGMRSRAQRLGATLTIDSGAHGTRIDLRLDSGAGAQPA